MKKITYNSLLKLLTQEQVDKWWENVSNKQVPEKDKRDNWKYYLKKGEKVIEFKWALRDLAKRHDYEFTTFNSSIGTRNSICEAFDFEIFEELIFDNTERHSFIKHYKKRINSPETFQKFINYANSIVITQKINTYKIRMAIDAKNQVLLIIGMRTILSYYEKNNKPIVGFLVSDVYADDQEIDLRYQYSGNTSQSYLDYTIENWKELKQTLFTDNYQEIQKQYHRVKDTKKSTWNSEANSTNSTIKYLVYKNLNIVDWYRNNSKKMDVKK